MSIYDFLNNYPEIVEKYIDDISRHSIINPGYVLIHYPHYKWNFVEFSKNPNVNIELVKQNLDKDWNWKSLSRHIKLEDIINNLDLPWDYGWMSHNKTINIEFIKQNLDKDWSWYCLS